MVYHHIVRLHVSVHYSHAVAVVQRPQQLIEVATYVIVSQSLKNISIAKVVKASLPDKAV